MQVSGEAKGFSLLQMHDFRCFWLSRVASVLAYQMLSVAVGWQIYDLTNSTFYLGVAGLLQFLPMVLLMLPAGHVIDRYNRTLIIRLCQLSEGLGVFLLAAGSFTGWLNKETLLSLVFLIGAARTFEMPCMQVLLTGVVEREVLPQALALAASSSQTAVIAGPALGGLLYTYGPGIVFACVSGLYFLSIFFLGRIRKKQEAVKSEKPDLRSALLGLSFIRSRPVILGAISLDLFAVLLGGATALLPVFAREILFVGPAGLGLLRSAPAVGSVLMALFLAHRPLQNQVGRKMFLAVMVFGLATIAFALSTSFALSIGALIVLGTADTISVVVRGALVQLNTPDEMRGRVSAVNALFVGTSNQLGEFESGMAATWLGLVPSVILGGAATILVALIWLNLFPSLKNIQHLESNG